MKADFCEFRSSRFVAADAVLRSAGVSPAGSAASRR